MKIINYFILSKRLTDKEKTFISKSFTEGKSIDDLASDFACTKLTIIRNLKKSIGEKKYKELSNQSKKINKSIEFKGKNNSIYDKNDFHEKSNDEYSEYEYTKEEDVPITPFIEITPLNYEIDNAIQKDLSSVPVSEVNFPNMVYMIVNKKIELETKYLREYPEWQFLSKEEQNRKIIEIYDDLKIAKRVCNKEQKVIKVPNTDVFKIVAPLLLNRGISRIVSPNRLISL